MVATAENIRLAFPERVLGRSLTMKIFLGAAKGPITFLTWSTSSLAREASSVGSYANSLIRSVGASSMKGRKTYGFSVTKAYTACPVNSSAVPMTAVSATPLCMIKADSISAVDRRCPETLITSTRLSLQAGYPPREVLTIDTAFDPNVTMFIASGTVSRIENSRVWLHVSLQVTVMVIVDRSGN
jgi:hypothetical protein